MDDKKKKKSEPSENSKKISGYFDLLNRDGIHGWAIQDDEIGRPVTVRIFLDDIELGHTETFLPRPDIDKLVETVSSSGFSFLFRDIASDHVGDILKIWNKPKIDGTEIVDRITVRAGDAETVLLPTAAESWSQNDADAVFDMLCQRQAAYEKNFEVIERADFLTNHPPKRAGTGNDVKVVAFYLPQFHPIPENDEWWGRGFTEWTNVASARPYFKDHRQPRRPGGLGFYDLRLDEVHRQQVETAKEFGVSAFCYYYYWFSGKPLLELPVKRHLEKNLDLDFCLCWANENWSRRWDGSDADVLLGQQHSYMDDVAFIDAVMPYFASDRYIKIDGAPLLIIYRVNILSDAKKVIREWRNAAIRAGYPDLHVAVAETFGIRGPMEYGADSAVQFPPHDVRARVITAEQEELDPAYSGHVYNYADVVANEIRRPPPGYDRFDAVMCAWDNTSRKGRAGNVFHGATPQLFQTWLSHLVVKTRTAKPSHLRYVFVNAWNEWAEGSYLEPDSHHGFDYLRAVRNALSVQGAISGELWAELGDTNPDLALKLQKAVDGMRESQAALVKSIEDLGVESRFASPFVEVDPKELGKLYESDESMCWLDEVMGRRQHGGIITLSTTTLLHLVGWVDVPNVFLTESWPLFFCLQPEGRSGGATYIASVNYRSVRKDVLAARNREVSDGHFNGFSFSGDVSKMDPGPYTLGTLVARGGSTLSFYEIETPWKIVVG